MKRLISSLLAVAVLVVMSAPAFAASYGSWSLSAGSTKISSAVKKAATGAIKVEPTTQTSSRKVWYRGRVGDNSDDKASEAKSYTSKPASISLPYLDGYGYVGNTYRLAVQNDSTSSGSATVAGSWTP